VVNRQRLDLPLAELDVRDAHARFAGVGFRDHLGRHIHADYIAAFANLPRRQEAVDPATAAQVEYGFAWVQAGDADRVAATERQPGDVDRQVSKQLGVIQAALAITAGVGVRAAAATCRARRDRRV